MQTMSWYDWMSSFWVGGSSHAPSRGQPPATSSMRFSPSSEFSPRPSIAVSGRQHSRPLQKFNGFHQLAKECISKAVKAEERGRGGEALPYYDKALEIIADGLAIPLDEQGEGVQKRVRNLLKWHDDVRDRVGALERRGVTRERVSRQGSYERSTSAQSAAVAKPQRAQARAPAGVSAARQSGSHGNSPAVGSTDESGQVASPRGAKRLDPKMAELIENEIVDRSPGVKWGDIAGLEGAKRALQEMVILPTIRSDLFQGLRQPARGLLLYGPPGNGKTMLAKAVASEAAATFFSVSASSFSSKWMGEGEKLMRTLFAVAAARQPSVIFIDEIDSILSARSSGEHEASRRLKTEFLVQFDGVMSDAADRVIVMGATNRPQELDDAARRRLVKRIYIPLPDPAARRGLLRHLLAGHGSAISDLEIDRIVAATEGYSGSDLRALCQEAAMAPIRELGPRISTVRADQVRKIGFADFAQALQAVRASVSPAQLREFEEWSAAYGSS